MEKVHTTAIGEIPTIFNLDNHSLTKELKKLEH